MGLVTSKTVVGGGVAFGKVEVEMKPLAMASSLSLGMSSDLKREFVL